MANEFAFRISTTRFDEDYSPSDSSRITTNFANLARGERRRENLRGALAMIDARLNDLARTDNPEGDRYTAELDIVSVNLRFEDDAEDAATHAADDREFPLLEVLDIHVLDRQTGERHHGIVGNNFSSYLRDYDFSILLPSAQQTPGAFVVPEDFGDLHGKLFQHFLESDAYRERFPQSPVVCISVSTSRTYRRNGNRHPVLGVEYEQDSFSLTDEYFAKMGLQVRYFMPRGSVAPLAFYHRGDLLAEYTDLQLAGTIGTMETFQKIYRPEIYNATEPAGEVYRPTLESDDFVRTDITYDRVERSQLATTQGKYAEEHFVTPHRQVLSRWAADYAAPTAEAVPAALTR
ncbi:putative oxygenase MesX [Microbacterium sp. M4A5_1d]